MYDTIIIGGGVSGLGAAIYAKRFGLKTLVLSDFFGGTITKTHLVENYPGFKSLSGFELAENIIEHAKSVEAELKDEPATAIKKTNKGFEVKTNKNTYESRTTIFATGTHHKKLGVKGEEEFANKGVSYCATCDGPFFRNKVVAVVGGSDSAIKESLMLAQFASKVYIIYRGENIRPEPINRKRMEETPKIEVITKTNITEIIGDTKLTKVKFDTGKELALDGLFIEIGRVAETEMAKKLGVVTNDKGEIKIDRMSKTNIEGFYAAGDVTDSAWKQAIVGVSEGVKAAYSAYTYIKTLNSQF